MFIDKVKIHLKSGNGGNGAVAWRREKYEPSGGPAGGNGGRGGSVIFKVDLSFNTLIDFRFKKKFKAADGENGRNKRQYGKDSKDLIIAVPKGTIVRDVESGLIIADLSEDDSIYVAAKGGRGGRGNIHFTTATRQAPAFAEAGRKGQEREVILELKMIADVGLLGFPNVGKSTFLSTITAAKPKIANYHFTTLSPNLGVVKVEAGKSFVIADIPGLIEGAHEGVGLGHEFLRHVERTKLLVHILDISGDEGRDPFDDFIKINEELEKYNEVLAKRPQIVVFNKTDLMDDEEILAYYREKIEKLGYEVYYMSAATMQGVEQLKYTIWQKLSSIGDLEPIFEVADESELIINDANKPKFEIEIENGIYYVEGDWIELLLNSTNFADYDSSSYFQKRLRDVGLIESLEAMGAGQDDVVIVSGMEFDFFE